MRVAKGPLAVVLLACLFLMSCAKPTSTPTPRPTDTPKYSSGEVVAIVKTRLSSECKNAALSGWIQTAPLNATYMGSGQWLVNWTEDYQVEEYYSSVSSTSVSTRQTPSDPPFTTWGTKLNEQEFQDSQGRTLKKWTWRASFYLNFWEESGSLSGANKGGDAFLSRVYTATPAPTRAS